LVEVPKKSICQLLVHEVLNPFYIFQVFSVILWVLDGYLMYAGTILTVSTLSVTAEIVENIRNSSRIREMARYTCLVTIRLTDKIGRSTLTEVDSSELLPGDVIIVPESKCLPCDLVLLTGSAIVNEAMLTGESIPVMKTSLPIIGTVHYST
jgi:cation-transporting P-type ATPase 13A2